MHGCSSQLRMDFASVDVVVNVASVPQRSPFRYPGGKTWLIPQVRRWLGSLSRQPKLLIEPFAGGAIVGLTAAFENLADRTLLVERDGAVASVWRALLNGKAEELATRILEFDMTIESVKQTLGSAPRKLVDRAFSTLLRNRVQHGGILAPGASLMKEGENGKGIGSRWYPATLAKRIRDIDQIKDRLRILHGDAFDVMHQYRDASNAVWFIDPPYTVAGRRLYRFSEVDHEGIFKAMSEVAGDFLMTYDDVVEVRQWAERYGFAVRQISMKSRQHTAKRELLIGRSLAWVRDH